MVMAVNIKWNTSNISSLSRSINEQKEIIVENKELLINLNKEVETAWQGYAGRTFDQRMDIDAENLELFVTTMEEIINDVDSVVRECYMECEDSVKNEINSLKNKI